VARAAAARRSPALVEASHQEVEMIGLRNLRSLVDNYRSEYGVEMYLNLDHSPTVAAARAAIDAGFEFIPIDVSQARRDATDDEIIAATREVVEHACCIGLRGRPVSEGGRLHQGVAGHLEGAAAC
jgi:fructose/tagatose bisphosphate aldolase